MAQSVWSFHGEPTLDELTQKKNLIDQELNQVNAQMSWLQEKKMELKGQLSILRALEKQMGVAAQLPIRLASSQQATSAS
jgi:prefoldin subunit 5